MNAILCSDKKRQGLKAQLSPSKVHVLAKAGVGGWRSLLGPVSLPRSLRPAPSLGPPTSTQAGLRRQISVGGALGARSPDPVQLLSRRQLGAQDPTGPQSPQALQTAGGQVPPTAARQTAAALGPSVGTGETFTAASRPGPGQRAALARAVEPSRTEPLACPPTPIHWPEAG